MNDWDFDLEINTVYDDEELTLQELLCKFDSEIEDVKDKINKIDKINNIDKIDKIDSFETSLNETNSKVDNIEDNLVTISGRITGVQNDVITTNNKVDSFESNLNEAIDKVDTVEYYLTETNGRVDNIETNFETTNDRLDKAENNISSLHYRLLDVENNNGGDAGNTGGNTVQVTNTLDSYDGATLNEKMVNMFNDINTNHKNTPMEIILPSGIIEINTNLVAREWTNKVFRCDGYLYYNNCDAIEFIQCSHCDIRIHASSSANINLSDGNILGLIGPNNAAVLTKRGYKVTDCCYNKFEFNNIIGFTNAIEIYSEYGAKGSFYNNIYFTAIWRCQRPMWFRTGKAIDDTSAQSGWITEIYTHGGMFDCDDGILIGQEIDNRPASEPGDNYQGLKFYNVGVEHVRKKENGRGIYFLQGKNNAVINPRFEGSLGGGNSTSGAYILVEESGYACNNRIETSNYPINVDRVKLNSLAKQLANPNYDNHAGSYIEGDLFDTNGFKCGYKAIATPGKMVYEAKNLSNYYLQNAKPNTFNYTYSDTEFAKVKGSDGTIRTIGYTS